MPAHHWRQDIWVALELQRVLTLKLIEVLQADTLGVERLRLQCLGDSLSPRVAIRKSCLCV